MLFLVSLLLLGTAVLGQHPVHGSTSGHDKRIIGGEFIPVHHLPHQAVIRQPVFGLGYNQCGAILIAPKWLLTAKHCLVSRDINEDSIDVYLGASRDEQIDNYSLNRTEGVVKRRVVRYFRSPAIEIGNRTEYSDLLLLKLDRKVENSVNIKPIELPEVGTRWMANQIAVTSGFGKIHTDDFHPSRTLQFTKLPILSKAHCLAMTRKRFPDDYQEFRLTVAPESILCAGYAEGGPSGCHGDSGGPLAVCATPLRDTSGGELLCKDNRWLLAGVISQALGSRFENKCGDPNRPVLHSNVPVFADWIRRTIRNN